MKLKVNDLVQVMAGKDKGKRGKIMRIDRSRNRVVIEKVNMRTKHIKRTAQKAGEKVTYEGSMHASNVMVVCPETDKPSRIGYRKIKDGKKERITRRGSATLDTKVTK